EFGARRVVDTSLSEEGIVGTSVGLALAGLNPVAEIQFRKYADAATEQLVNCGSIRWRTNGRFVAPVIVRMPVGVSRKVGDPWHSVSGESIWAHHIGWHIVMPSTTNDAVGLLRTAFRSGNPVMFLEHRALLDAEFARGVYPGDEHQLPFGQANLVREGAKATIVSWGLMLERSLAAINETSADVELIDLRTIQPWDSETVIKSVNKTGRLLIVHEDSISAGFGAEIAAVVANRALFSLDAPIERLAVNDLPIPYNPVLTNEVVPNVERIAARILELLAA
ncbi:UNVERIFIED_CONTAM: hypothetical protein GTU68_042500, partial [Idotea baltica]|nr:hypothetical protein [Idotea baltica]